MVINKTIKAFTLVETIITLTIVMIVVATGIPVFSKKKAPVESIGLRGQYGCWYNASGVLVEQYFDERTPRTDEPKIAKDPTTGEAKCTLRLDKRPSHFYIIATGAGNNTGTGRPASGELITRYSPTIDSKMTIIPAKANSLLPTTITNTSGDKIEARSGAIAKEILPPSNLKNCKLHSSGKNCPNGAKDNAGNTKKQQYCDLVAVVDEGNITYNVRINGCEKFDASGNLETTHIIPTTIDTVTGTLKRTTTRPTLSYPFGYSTISASYTDTYKYNNTSYGSNTYEVSFDFNNSNFVPDRYLFDSDTSLLELMFLQRSKMTRILSTIPYRRRSELTELFRTSNFGSPGKDGAVLIMW